MLDIRFIRENVGALKQALVDRNLDIDIDGFIALDEARRKAAVELDELRATKNKANDEISRLLKEKQDPAQAIAAMKDVARQIDEREAQVRELQSQLDTRILAIPNVPHESIPRGDPSHNAIVRTWGQLRKFDFKPVGHTDICQRLDIIDFPRATKITGSNFILYKRSGARLERALINFMLDLHTRTHGYTEIFPPFLVNRASMTGTGQLPKLEEDMYRLKDDDLFLIPTAEVPVTNIHRDEVLEESELPVRYAAFSACFRREAGSYGKDTKGLMRVHQFNKVEMVKFVKPENSYDELEKLLGNAEAVLQALELPYRVVMLATQDLSFSASKCYDLEAYAPGTDRWLEVSSCSNFESFQARRANIKFRRSDTKKLEYVHTLNGSGVATARTVIAILENYQQQDGSVRIPRVLQEYMDGKERIE